MAHARAHRHGLGDIPRRLRRALARFRVAGADRPLAHEPGRSRLDDRRELHRSAGRRASVQPACGKLRPRALRGAGDGAHVGHEPGLRLRGQFPDALHFPSCAGNRRRRRDAGRGDLHQRNVARSRARTLLHAVRNDLPRRPDGLRTDRHIAGPDLRLESALRAGRHPRPDRHLSPASPAGIAALADRPRAPRGSRNQHRAQRVRRFLPCWFRKVAGAKCFPASTVVAR
jgi:hypothetical protein